MWPLISFSKAAVAIAIAGFHESGDPIRLKSNMLNWRTSSINRYEDDGLFGVGTLVVNHEPHRHCSALPQGIRKNGLGYW